MSHDDLILAALSGPPLDVAEIAYYTRLPANVVWAALSNLMQRGVVAPVPHPYRTPNPRPRFTVTSESRFADREADREAAREEEVP